jgi:hypothetical protein
MKFIFNKNYPKNTPVNIEKVEHIEKTSWLLHSDSSKRIYALKFHGGRYDYTWSFKTEEERDETYDLVLASAQTQDISTITTL